MEPRIDGLVAAFVIVRVIDVVDPADRCDWLVDVGQNVLLVSLGPCRQSEYCLLLDDGGLADPVGTRTTASAARAAKTNSGHSAPRR
jgi:hypothetical protein